MALGAGRALLNGAVARTLAVCALVVVALAGCANPAPGDAAEPAVGECRILDRPEQFRSVSDSSPAVDCSAAHTVETIQIADLSATRWDARYPALEERNAIATEVCSPELVREYVGALDRQALYGLWTFAFVPTLEQWQDGARWVRCDLAAVADETAPFEPLPLDGTMRGTATDPGFDAHLRCYAEEEPGEWADVPCSAEHHSRDVNMWMPVAQEPGQLEIVQRCVPAVAEWTTLGLRPVADVSGVVRAEANGNLTLRCVAVEVADAG